MLSGLPRRSGWQEAVLVRNSLRPARFHHHRLWRSIMDQWPARCDLGVPPPPAKRDPAQPGSTLSHAPLISPTHRKPLSHTTSQPFASLAGSRRHRGWHVLRPPYSRMWAVFGAVWAQKRSPGAEFCAASADGVDFGQSCRMYVRVSSCSCVLSVSSDERARPRCVPVHGPS